MAAWYRSLPLVILTLVVSGAGADEPTVPSLSATDFVPDPASVMREGPGYRYTQCGWIVLHIEGAPYERGFQHGKLLAAEISERMLALATARSPKAPSDAWRDLRMITNALFLRRYDAEYLEEMKGIADGAAAAGCKFDGRSVDLVDVVALNSDIEVDFLEAGLDATPNGLEGRKFREPADGQLSGEQDDHCSAFAATGPATADGQIVFGHITMFNLQAVRHFNVWIDIQPKDGHHLVMQTYPGGIMSGLDYYMNDAGLLCSETTISQTRFNPDGAPLAARIRRVAQYADSIDKAVEILLSGNNGLYTNQWLLGDTKTNEVAMFELGTGTHKLWRSSKKEFPGGTEGFYWGCNNTKDLEVRKETVPSLTAKPANMIFYPHPRDVMWQQLFRDNRGKIDTNFGYKAFTTPPLASFTSCDAKFTTTALAKDLKSWAIFGPPRGRTWDATQEELRRIADTKPLVSNDWALVHVTAPKAAENLAKAVDLAPFPKAEKTESPILAKTDPRRVLPAAWNGTLLPESDGDIWLAAAFSDFEKIVSLEKSLKRTAKDGTLDKEAREQLALALFAPQSRWQAAVRRLGRDLPLAEVKQDYAQGEWYAIASGKGVMLLAALRSHLGGEAFDGALDEFGRAHGGKAVNSKQFREHLEKAAGHSLAVIFDPWLTGSPTVEAGQQSSWAVTSFETEPLRTLIVYGTLGDREAQREAAERLQRKITRRGGNFVVPIKSDVDATDDELRNHHVLLVGRPGTNCATERLAGGLPLRFGSGSFVVRGETYAHADSAVIAAGNNPLNDRFSVVVFAGLGARATWHAIDGLANRGGDLAEVVVLPARLPAKALRITSPPIATAMP